MTEAQAVRDATHVAEQAVLGAILIESSYAGKHGVALALSLGLRATHFLGHDTTVPRLDSQHSRIYQAMSLCELPPHEINTARKMNEMGLLQAGDCAYLREMVALCPCSLDLESYARAVIHYALRRGATAKRGGVVIE